MGRAKIVSGGTDGKYTVDVDYGKAQRDARVAKLAEQLLELAEQLTQAQAKYDEQLEVVDALQAAADAAIDAWAAAQALDPKKKHDALQKKATEALTAKIRAEAKAAPLRLKVEDLKALRKDLQATQNGLMAVQVEETLANVWCVDLTEDAEVGSEVITIEVPGENQAVLIAPGAQTYLGLLQANFSHFAKGKNVTGPQFIAAVLVTLDKMDSGSSYSALIAEVAKAYQKGVINDGEYTACIGAIEGKSGGLWADMIREQPGDSFADGALAARELMSPEQAFLNAAILPGWQKWKPTYRKGTITALADEKVAVDLDAATSSAQRLDVNWTQALADVPVRYMTCDAAAFDVGDRVIVMFDSMNQESPKVIGFVEKPKPCMNYEVYSALTSPINPSGYKNIGLLLRTSKEGFFRWSLGCRVEARRDGGAWVPLVGRTATHNGGASIVWDDAHLFPAIPYQYRFLLQSMTSRAYGFFGSYVWVDEVVGVGLYPFNSENGSFAAGAYTVGGEIVEYRAFDADDKLFFTAIFETTVEFLNRGGVCRVTPKVEVIEGNTAITEGGYVPSIEQVARKTLLDLVG